LTIYDGECKRLADEARRTREAEERRARQEADAKAAAERARAEEQAAAARKLAEEAEAKRVAAVAEGNKRAAAAAAAEKAKQEEQARSVIENGEAKAMELQLAAAAAPTTVVAPEPVKLAGFSTRENWVAEFAAGMREDDVKLALCQAIAGGRPDLLALLAIDMPAANRLAKAQKKNMHAPGLQAVNRPVATSRAA
jgi:ATPase subunit of ABC transporter with duplicated ATPase domains